MTASVRKPQHDDVRPSPLRLDDFFGQKLVVIFCPPEERAASAELEAYQVRAQSFQRAGAWLVAVAPGNKVVSPAGGEAHVRLAIDADGLAFEIMAARLPDVTDARDGIVFLVDRDGIARHAWPGPGRADDVLAGVRERP